MVRGALKTIRQTEFRFWEVPKIGWVGEKTMSELGEFRGNIFNNYYSQRIWAKGLFEGRKRDISWSSDQFSPWVRIWWDFLPFFRSSKVTVTAEEDILSPKFKILENKIRRNSYWLRDSLLWVTRGMPSAKVGNPFYGTSLRVSDTGMITVLLWRALQIIFVFWAVKEKRSPSRYILSDCRQYFKHTFSKPKLSVQCPVSCSPEAKLLWDAPQLPGSTKTPFLYIILRR